MTASKNEAQPVIGKMHGRVIHGEVSRQSEGRRFVKQRILFLKFGSLPPALVDQISVSGRSDPSRGVLRNPFAGPGGERGSKRFLHRLLGVIERSGDTNQ